MSHLLQNTKLQLFIIILLTFLAYSNIFQNGFVLDDDSFFQNWEAKKSINNLPVILKGDLPGKHQGRGYRPVRGVIFVLYHQLFAENPLGYHLHSILVHLASTILVYFIVREFIRGPVRRHPQSTSLSFGLLRTAGSHWGAPTPATPHKLTLLPFISSLLFGLHPIHTESITFMTSAMDMTGVVFMLTSFYLYILTTGPVSSVSRQLSSQSLIINHKSLIIASCLFALLAFFTYEPTIILPLLILVYHFCFFFAKTGNLMLKILPFLLGIAAYWYLRTALVGNNPAGYKFYGESLYHTQLLMAKVILKYFSLLALPVSLSINHIISPGFETFALGINDVGQFLGQSILDKEVIFALVLVTLLAISAVFFRKKYPLVSFSIFWFFISYLPFANLFPQQTALAERYLYIPSLGFVLLISFLLVKARDYLQQVQSLKFKVKNYSAKLKILNFNLSSVISEGKSLLILHSALLILVSFYFLQTYQRNKDWKNGYSLWQKAHELYPQSAYSAYVFGNMVRFSGEETKAVKLYEEAINKRPNFVWPYFNLGAIYYNKKDYAKSLELLEKGTQADLNTIDPNSPFAIRQDIARAYFIKALIFRDQGLWDQAFLNLQYALSYEPGAAAIQNAISELASKEPELKKAANFSDREFWQKYTFDKGFIFHFPKAWLKEVKDGSIIFTFKDSRLNIKQRTGKGSGENDLSGMRRIILMGFEDIYTDAGQGDKSLRYILVHPKKTLGFVLENYDTEFLIWFNTLVASIKIE